MLHRDNLPLVDLISAPLKKVSPLSSITLLETQPVVTLAYAACLYAGLWLSAWLIGQFRHVELARTPASGRYGALDGLRGVLAGGVLIHHSVAMYLYFINDHWAWSASPILNHLGQTTVALFFMITGFLFTLRAQTAQMDWPRFYLARLARLLPLYAVLVSGLFMLVFVLSGWRWTESLPRLMMALFQWLAFVCFGRPDINGMSQTWVMVAGVNWSLKYEVWFYLCAVPCLHYLSRLVNANTQLLISGTILLALLAWGIYQGELIIHGLFLTHFMCGIVAANLYQQSQVLRWLQNPRFHYLSASLLPLFYFYSDAQNSVAVVLALILFLAVLGGMSGWGLLKNRAVIWLGDISYGIYLLHGITLWCALYLLKRYDILAKLNLLQYLGIMVLVAAFVVGLASLSYLYLERPVMQYVKRLSNKRIRVQPTLTV